MMTPSQAYKAKADLPLPRIEILLRSYDGIVELLDQALALQKSDDADGARSLLLHVQVIVRALVLGVDARYGELPKNYLRLYEFVQYSLAAGDAESVEAAKKVVVILREGLEEIRAQALQLERRGQVPNLAEQGTFEAFV